MEEKMSSKVFKIEGMTCASCETRIENALKKLDGVIEVKARYISSTAKITYDPQHVGLDQMIQTIEKVDYKVVQEQQHLQNKEPVTNDNKKLIGIAIIVLAVYLIIKYTIGFNFIPEVTANMGFGILFVIGLLTSLHCIAMCGGINLSQCVSYQFSEDDTSKFSKMKPGFLYNSGRVISYTIIGGIVGALGHFVGFSGPAKGIIAILSGLFMMIMGLNMLNIFPWLRKLNPRMPKFLNTKLRKNNSQNGPFYVGLINGFMPCGPLQAMQLYALGTGSFITGALSMFFFSIGTVPLMFGFGALSSYIGRKLTRDMMKVSAILVIMLGVVLAGRGLNLSGINMMSLPMGNGVKAESVTSEDQNVQLVTTTLKSGRYAPIVVKKGIPVKWNIQVAEGDLNGCNRSITIPTYNLDKDLAVGDNFIEFIPTEEGEFTYTCWMGMIRSTITVVANDASQQTEGTNVTETEASQEDLQLDLGSSSSTGNCCADGAKATRFIGGKIPTDDMTLAKIENNQQVVTVTVNDQGYSPAVIVVQKGIEVKIKFNTEQLNGCNSIVVFPEYGGQLDLNNAAQIETPFLDPVQDFTFQCSMSMLHGYVKVVDDLNAVDLEAVKAEISQFTPAVGSGSGGCH